LSRELRCMVCRTSPLTIRRAARARSAHSGAGSQIGILRQVLDFLTARCGEFSCSPHFG
jgi:hypothetical protein